MYFLAGIAVYRIIEFFNILRKDETAISPIENTVTVNNIINKTNITFCFIGVMRLAEPIKLNKRISEIVINPT